MMSIEACLEVIIPALVRELEDYVPHFDDIRIYSVGHSLGGLLSRFIFNRRLGDLFAAQKEKKSCPYTFLRDDLSARLASVIGNERVHLQTLCTLASPHAGSLGTNALLRFLPEIVSKFRFLLASQMAQQICNLDESNLLERLCIYEAAGDSWIWPEMIENIQDLLNASSSLEDLNNVCSLEPTTPAPIDGSAKVSSLHDRQAPAAENCEAAIVSYEEYGKGRKSFQKVVLYGILNTDWLVSANSALGTQLDVTKTHAAEHALIEEMTPISFDPATEFDCGILPDLLTEEAGEAIRKAGRELEILETLPKVERFLVHIPQNPIMTKPHSTIKGAPSRVTPEKEKSMRLTARRILRHVGRSVVGR